MSSISDYHVYYKYYTQFLCKSQFTWIGKLNLSIKKIILWMLFRIFRLLFLQELTVTELEPSSFLSHKIIIKTVILFQFVGL